jgi:tRNA(Ile)-lysidine synthase
MNLLATLREFFSRPAFSPPRPLLVAFSGGSDSTALLAGLAILKDQGFAPAATLFAAHLDHGSDDSSAERARRAGASAALLGVPFLCERRDVGALRAAGESWETAARRIRYDFLEEARQACGAGWISLAHHRDDQAETVILRWLLGSGLHGLAAMREVHGAKVRPLLGVAKAELVAFVTARGLDTGEDPTNLDPSSLRNRIRHRLLPALAAAERLPDLSARLARLAARAAGASDAISARLAERFPSLAAADPSLDLSALQELPRELLGPALAALARAAGLPLPPSRRALEELLRQLALPGGARSVGTTLGPGRCWRIDSNRLRIETVRPADSGDPSEISRFTYTFSVPGRIEVPEAGVVFSLRRGDFAPWMLTGEPHRAGLLLPLRDAHEEVEIRSRRPGDRLHPLGAPGTRTLKEILIDRRIDRARRSTLPLLCVGGAIAWVPGVTVDDRFRVRGPEGPVWIAEIEPLPQALQPLSTGRSAATGNPQAQRAVTPMEREPHALASEVAEP